MCVTDRHDMTLAVKVVFNTNTTNQQATCMSQVISKHTEHYGIISCTTNCRFRKKKKKENLIVTQSVRSLPLQNMHTVPHLTSSCDYCLKYHFDQVDAITQTDTIFHEFRYGRCACGNIWNGCFQQI